MSVSPLLLAAPALIGLLILIRASRTNLVLPTVSRPGISAPPPPPEPLPAPGVSWQASLEAERNRLYPVALDYVARYEAAGGEPYLAAYRRGQLRYALNDGPGAVRSYREAHALKPTSPAPLFGLLDAARKAGDREALTLASEALEGKKPLDRRNETEKVGRHLQEKRHHEALLGCHRILDYHPDDIAVRSWEAWAYHYLGRGWEAVKSFEILLGLHPHYPRAEFGLNLCLDLHMKTLQAEGGEMEGG